MNISTATISVLVVVRAILRVSEVWDSMVSFAAEIIIFQIMQNLT